MQCEKCGITMSIDTWSGWRWVCFFCDTEGREATEEEIVKQENEYCKREERSLKNENRSIN